MPVKTKRRPRSKVADPLSEGAFMLFGTGDFFEGEDYKRATTPDERREHWAQYRSLYIERFRAERPELAHLETWGEYLEGRGEL